MSYRHSRACNKQTRRREVLRFELCPAAGDANYSSTVPLAQRACSVRRRSTQISAIVYCFYRHCRMAIKQRAWRQGGHYKTGQCCAIGAATTEIQRVRYCLKCATRRVSASIVGGEIVASRSPERLVLTTSKGKVCWSRPLSTCRHLGGRHDLSPV